MKAQYTTDILGEEHAVFIAETTPCKHPDYFIKVLNVMGNCETTVKSCIECGKWLEPPKTDCV